MGNQLDEKGEECTVWDRIFMLDGCTLFEKGDPRMFYFSVTVFTFYVVFLILILADLKYWWSLDKAQQQILYYVDCVKKKLRNVQTQQRRMAEVREKTDNYLKKNRSYVRLLKSVRALGDQDVDLSCDPRYSVATLTGNEEEELWLPILEDDSSNFGEFVNYKDDEYCVL